MEERQGGDALMVRRLLVHVMALVVGGLLGIVAGQWLTDDPAVPDYVFAVILALFIFGFQVVAYFVARWLSRPRPAYLPEPAPRGSETWGWLKPSSGVGGGFPLNKDRISVGRGVDMDITLNNASISRRHAELVRLMDGCLVRDAGSRNGVFVNGMRVQEQLLSDGDSVGMGEVRFVFVQMNNRPRASQEVHTPPLLEGRASSEGEGGHASPHGRGEPRGNGQEARPFDDTADVESPE